MRDDIRARAYRAAATITRERLRRDAPERARALESVQAGDVVAKLQHRREAAVGRRVGALARGQRDAVDQDGIAGRRCRIGLDRREGDAAWHSHVRIHGQTVQYRAGASA